MNKKLLTIFLSLFLVGILSISCSNSDKTGAGDTSTPKTINTKYSGIWSSSYNPAAVEIDINGNIYEYQNSSRGTKGEIIEANDPTYKVKIYNDEVTIKFTDENNATVNIDGQDITYTKTSKGIEQYNDNTYVSKNSFDASSVMPELKTAYLWVSVKDGKIATIPNDNNITPPNFTGMYMTGPITGYGTDYTFDAGDGKTKGTLKFASDGSSVTVRYTKNPDAPSFENKDFICNKKQ
ncbi:hypothetical protein R4J00_11005 [Brachyspira intermedia]|uniref:hypothetical protein n=1 Tax=Brachyspira intermedia TaxID=84377 RepID=UPI003007EB96